MLLFIAIYMRNFAKLFINIYFTYPIDSFLFIVLLAGEFHPRVFLDCILGGLKPRIFDIIFTSL